MSQRVWTTKAGVRIPIAGLTDGHLVNLLRYLARRAHVLVELYAGREELITGGDDIFATLRDLVAEAERRGLDVADPGHGTGIAVARKDVFDEIPDPLGLPAPSDENSG